MDLRRVGRRAAIWLMIVGALVAFTTGVWPTAWRYEPSPAALVRINRTSGEVQSLCSDGWRTLEPDPFADLADDHRLAPMCFNPLPARPRK
jgi:hypothetical protein